MLGFAVVVGGIWSFYVFDASLSVENAKAQVEKLENELITRPALNIDVVAKNLGEVDGAKVVHIKTTLSNHGNSDTRLEWGAKPIRVERVSFDKNGAEKSGYVLDVALSHISSGLRVNDELELKAVVKVPGSGLYRVIFRSPSEEEHATSLNSIDRVFWYSSAYVVVD